MPEADEHATVAVRLGAFVLGAAVIIDAMVVRAGVIQWVAGLVLIGTVPPDAIVNRMRRKPNGG